MSTFNIKTAYHDALASSEGNWGLWVDRKLSDMTLLLGMARPVSVCNDDVPGCVLFDRITDEVGHFSGDGYQVIDSDAKAQAVLGLIDWHYKVVAQIDAGFGEYGEDGLASSTARTIIVAKSADADTWAHEFGHTQGITRHRNDYCRDAVMYNDWDEDDVRDVINDAERAKFVLNPDAQNFLCSSNTPPGLRYFIAFNEQGSIRLRFRTDIEYQLEGLKVYRNETMPDSAVLVANLPPAGGDVSVEYTTVDPLGTVGDSYSLFAVRTGRSDIHMGSCTAMDSVSTVPWEPGWCNPDSLMNLLTGGDPIIEQLPDPCRTSIPAYAILGPDSFSTALTLYANIWRDRGVNAKFVALSYVDSCAGSVDEYLSYCSTRGLVAALLVGDASDSALWDTPSAWNYPGWAYPTDEICGGTAHPPGDSHKNILPTCYYPYTVGPQNYSMTYWTPYYASDLPYSDTGSDGLPDIALGRLPASSKAEIINYTTKLAKYLQATNNTIPRSCFQIGYAINSLPAASGEEAEWGLDEVADAVPVGVALSRYYLRGNPSWPEVVKTGSLQGATNGRDAANYAANSGGGVIAWQSNATDQYQWIPSWNVFLGWTVEDLAVPSQAFIGVGLSCGMANYDMTEYQDWRCEWGRVRPIAERLLVHPQKGAIAIIGPSRGSVQRGTTFFGRELIPRLFQPGMNVGTAFNLALRACLVKHSELTDQFREFMLLGDPLVGATNLSATGITPQPESGIRARLSISSARPNPFNGNLTAIIAPGKYSQVSVYVFDVQGRLVRDLGAHLTVGGGDLIVSWDGLQQSGSPAASGVYFISAKTAGERSTVRVVLLR